MYDVKYLKNDYQKKIFEQSYKVLDKHNKVGLDVFTSGGKSPISAELINYLRENHDCSNVLVVSSDQTWEALSGKYKLIGFSLDNIYHVKNVTLSRGTSLHDAIKESGIEPDDIDIILFDECHRLFGENIHAEIEKNKKYIYSKYVIAMTATRLNGIKMIDSLNELVGNKCIITYNLNDAVSNDVIDQINMVNVSLRCAPEYFEYINTLINEKGNKITNKALLKVITDTKNLIKKKNIDTVENVIYNNIIDGASRCKVKLNGKDGARVIIFFNRIADVNKTKETLTNVISKVYSGCNINYVKYTSKSSDEETEQALSILTSDTSTPNQVDVIATCDVAAESFHPANVQLGIVFGGTQSIRKELQRIGRFITLKQYKKCDCIIFDFSESCKKLGERSIIVGKTELDMRMKDTLRLSRYFNDKQSDISELLYEYDGSINIISSNIDNNILDMLDRTEALLNIMEGNDDLIDYIDNNWKAIANRDTYFYNISKFLRDMTKVTPEVASKNYYERYEIIRKYMMYPMLKEKDREMLKDSFGKYGVSNYLSATLSADKTTYTKMLYKSIENGSFDVEKYWKSYTIKDMSSDCIMMIRQHEDILTDINNRILNSFPTQFGVMSGSKIEMIATLLISSIKALDNVSGKQLIKLNKFITVCYKYIEVICTDDSLREDIRGYLTTLATVINDLDIKLVKLKKSDIYAIKYIFALDILRSKNNETINNNKLESYVFSLKPNKLSSIEQRTIDMCLINSEDTVEDFIEQCIKMTKAYKLSYRASCNGKCSDKLKLKTFVDNGGIIPKEIQIEFDTKKILSKANNIYKVKCNIKEANKNTSYVTPMELLEIVISNDAIYSEVQSLIFIKNGKVYDENNRNYNRILNSIRNNAEINVRHTLRSISEYKIIKSNAAIQSVINDIYM